MTVVYKKELLPLYWVPKSSAESKSKYHETGLHEQHIQKNGKYNAKENTPYIYQKNNNASKHKNILTQ